MKTSNFSRTSFKNSGHMLQWRIQISIDWSQNTSFTNLSSNVETKTYRCDNRWIQINTFQCFCRFLRIVVILIMIIVTITCFCFVNCNFVWRWITPHLCLIYNNVHWWFDTITFGCELLIVRITKPILSVHTKSSLTK